MNIDSSTWRILGLTVGIGYTILGSFAVTQSTLAARLFDLHPRAVDYLSPAADKVSLQLGAAHAESISTSMILLGARDLSIGAALLTFHYKEDEKAMGTLILSGSILCATDVVYIWRRRGWEWGSAFAAGATSWAMIGMGLLEYI